MAWRLPGQAWVSAPREGGGRGSAGGGQFISYQQVEAAIRQSNYLAGLFVLETTPESRRDPVQYSASSHVIKFPKLGLQIIFCFTLRSMRCPAALPDPAAM